jgi:hypothetical protein
MLNGQSIELKIGIYTSLREIYQKTDRDANGFWLLPALE